MSQVGLESKTERILTIYKMLLDGEVVNKMRIADHFHVTPRSVQRDIEDIRAYFSNNSEMVGENFSVIYDHKKKGFRLTNDSEKMSGGELLSVCKVLLESRAFVKAELEPILEKLIYNCVPSSERKQAIDLIANERFHYIEPHHHKKLVDRIWELGGAVRNQQYTKIWYKKLKKEQPVFRLVKPVGIMFSEFYFYLIAFIENDGEETKYLSPAIYRIDRIYSLSVLDKHFAVPYKGRFEEGEFRKRVQFMFGGRLQRIVFEYSGMSVESVLDRLPTAEIIEERDWDDEGKKTYTIRAEVFGDGIDMWLRSQGEKVRVISRKLLN
ncbi:MAG: helix-turn-helix transcriptional regulator [Lachnospiraceae bacterium]